MFVRQFVICMMLGVWRLVAECNSPVRVPMRLIDDTILDRTRLDPTRLDRTRLDPKILVAAREEAAWVLRSLCVEAQWSDGTFRADLTMRILMEPLTPDVPKRAMGLSLLNPNHGNRGAVFLSRVQAMHQAQPMLIDFPTLLGCVLAHEIGHLLLRTNAHPAEGIMKEKMGNAELLLGSRRRLVFTDADRKLFLRGGS